MSRGKKNKRGSYWGLFLSILLHGTIVVLVLFWGIKRYDRFNLSQPINVSLSELNYKEVSDKAGESSKKEILEYKKEVQPEVKKEVAKRESKQEEKKDKIKKVKKKVAKKKKQEPKKQKVVKKKQELKKKEIKKGVAKRDIRQGEKKSEIKKVKKKVEKKKEEKPKTDTNIARSEVLNDLRRKSVINNLRERSKTNKFNSDQTDSGGMKDTDEKNAKKDSAILGFYKNAITDRIQNKFKTTLNILLHESLTANVYFKINNNGNVSGVRINKPSGNTAFDNFCINAVISSSPLPPPPKDIAKRVVSEGFEIELGSGN